MGRVLAAWCVNSSAIPSCELEKMRSDQEKDDLNVGIRFAIARKDE